MPEILALMIPITALLIPISVIWTKHRQRMEELRLGGRGVAAGLVEEVRKLQEQVTELRDTTTRYDLSFDAALQRILGSQSWTGPQRDWLKKIAAQTRANVLVDRAALDEDGLIFKREGGGFARLDRIFDHQLEAVLENFNDYIWEPGA